MSHEFYLNLNISTHKIQWNVIKTSEAKNLSEFIGVLFRWDWSIGMLQEKT